MKHKIIALVALKESGKSTFFSEAKKIHNVKEIMLAARLKKACSEAFGVPEEHFSNQNHKEKPAIQNAHERIHGTVLTSKRLSVILEVFGAEEYYDTVKGHIGTPLPTPRKMAQYIGTEVLRSIDPDIHIKKAIEDLDKNKINIVTDVRFFNELEAFANDSFDTVSVHIIRPDKTPEDLEAAHQSERDVLEVGKRCDIVIKNEDFEGYKEEVREALERILEKW